MTNYSNDVTHYRVRPALSWAMSSFARHAVALLIPTVVFVVVLVGLRVSLTELVTQVTPAPQVSPARDAAGRLAAYLSSTRNLGTLLEGVVLLVVFGVMQSAYVGGMLDLAAGRPVNLVSFLKPRNVGNVIGASMVAGVVILAGAAFCAVLGIVAGVLVMFTNVALLDRQLSPLDAVKASIDLGKANFWTLVLALLVVYAVLVVGALTFGVGVLVAIPVAALFMVHTHHRLTGRDVAPA